MEQIGAKFILESETSKAQTGVEAVNSALSSLDKNARKAGGGVDVVTRANERLSKAQQQLSKVSVNANGTLTSFNRIVQDAPFGLMGVGNNISQFAEQFGGLVKSTGSAGAAIKAIGQSFIGSGGFVFAVSAGISAITALQQKYGSVSTGILALTGQINALTIAQGKLTDETAKSVGKMQSELSIVQGYLAVARDEIISRDQRNKALKEAQKLYPGYLDNITLDTINTQRSKEAIDQLSLSLIRKARIQGALNIISEESEKIFRAQNSSIYDNANALDVFTSMLQSGQLQTSLFSSILQKGAERQNKVLSDSQSIVDRMNGIIQGLLKEDALNGLIGFGSKGNDKKIKTVSDVLKELDKELSVVQSRNDLLGISADNLSKEKLGALNKAFEEIAKIGGPAARKELGKIKEQVDILRSAFLGETPIIGKQIFGFKERTVKDPFTTGEGVKRQVIDIPVNFALDQNILSASQKKLVGQIRKVTEDPLEGARIDALIAAQKFEESFSESINSAIRGGAASLASGIGDAVGSIIGGGASLQDAFKGVIGIFGNFIKQLGEAMIASGTAMIASKLLLKNPYTAVAAGIIAVAAGSAIQAAMNKAPSFATGGIANGPMLAMIGDNPGRREAIVPSEDWREAFGGAGREIRVTGVLTGDGTKLKALITNVERMQGRTNG